MLDPVNHQKLREAESLRQWQSTMLLSLVKLPITADGEWTAVGRTAVGKTVKKFPGASVRGDLRQDNSGTTEERGNTHIYTAGVGEGLE